MSRIAASPPATPSLPATIVLHALTEARRLLRLRTAWPALAIVALTATLGVLVAYRRIPDLLAVPDFFGNIGLPAIALLGIGYGTSSLRGDAERGALSLFLLRPGGAIALPLGRAIAVLTAMSLCGMALAGALAGGAAALAISPPEGQVITMLLTGALAGTCYSAVAMLLATIFKRATAAAIAWLVVVDMMIASGSETVALISPGPHLGAMLERAYDMPLYGDGSGDLWLATLHVLAIAMVAVGSLLLRFAGDEPT